MWSFLLYIGAVVVGLVLIWFFDPKEERKDSQTVEDLNYYEKRRLRFRKKNVQSFLGVLGFRESPNSFQAFEDHFVDLSEVSTACRSAGLERSNLIIGIDFTASNEWQGKKRFKQNCLHKLMGNKTYNPYQRVISILGQTLKPFDEDNLIPAYGFGDSRTVDKDVFCFIEDEQPCKGFEEVMLRYNEAVKVATLSGPTSFAPIIRKAIEIVHRTRSYHILVIIADGQVNEEDPTIDAIVDASLYPLSIIVVGVGDGPWDIMEEFDHRLPTRKFDNFHFVDFHKATSGTKHCDTAFALQALMEIPDQYKTIKSLGYLNNEDLSPAKEKRRLFKVSQDRNGNSPVISNFCCAEEIDGYYGKTPSPTHWRHNRHSPSPSPVHHRPTHL